jgi:riboflavin kinase/FMN adenylyltransferase
LITASFLSFFYYPVSFYWQHRSGKDYMLVEEELAEFSPEKETLLTIGVFDGVHLGHKYLISQLKEKAGHQNLQSGVVTFRQHPLEVISPGTELPYLTSISEKVSLLKNEGVEVVATLSFTPELAELSAEQFTGLLQKYLRMRGLIIGPDFSLGKNREGNADTLKKLGEKMGFNVTVVHPVELDGEVVSSTAVRDALAVGDIKRVIKLMGRPFRLQGSVTVGDGRGKELGYPTANLEIDSPQSLLPEGVYATRTYIGDKAYKSITNIGKRPTFGSNGRTVETYILGYQGNLYGREIKIDFLDMLRGEKRFDSVEELKKQIAEDVERVKAIPEYKEDG